MCFTTSEFGQGQKPRRLNLLVGKDIRAEMLRVVTDVFIFTQILSLFECLELLLPPWMTSYQSTRSEMTSCCSLHPRCFTGVAGTHVTFALGKLLASSPFAASCCLVCVCVCMNKYPGESPYYSEVFSLLLHISSHADSSNSHLISDTSKSTYTAKHPAVALNRHQNGRRFTGSDQYYPSRR